MNVLIMTDIEGVSGVVSFEHQAYATGAYYEQARRLLTGELNAAIDAAVNAGAEEVLVIDGHGPGAVVFEDLHPAAALAHGRPPAPRVRRREYIEHFDVTMMIGQHAMAGTERGTLNHTQSSRSVVSYTLNGNPIGEIAQWGLYTGGLGIPLIFLSGDDAACREATALVPAIHTAAVKKGISRSYAVSLSIQQSHDLIRSGVAQALRHHRESPVDPLVWPGPYTLVKRYMTTEQADAASNDPRARKTDPQTVVIEGDDILEIAYA